MKLMTGIVAGAVAVVGAAALVVPGTPTNAQGANPGAAAFATCKACHTLNAGGRNGIGPNLHGVFGRKAGTAPGYNYSAAMKKSGLTWNDATLNEFVAAPTKKVPGTKMPVGLADAKKRAALISYLKAETAK